MYCLWFLLPAKSVFIFKIHVVFLHLSCVCVCVCCFDCKIVHILWCWILLKLEPTVTSFMIIVQYSLSKLPWLIYSQAILNSFEKVTDTRFFVYEMISFHKLKKVFVYKILRPNHIQTSRIFKILLLYRKIGLKKEKHKKLTSCICMI